jgi:putative transposase
MFLSFNYLLRPTKEQHAMLDYLLEQARFVYNEALSQRIRLYETEGGHMNHRDQRPYFRDLRRANPDTLGLLNFQTMTEALRHLDKAYAATFRRIKAGEKTGFPKFISKRCFRSFELHYGNGCRLFCEPGEPVRFRIQNVGALKVVYHRAIPDKGEIKHVILKRKNERWYVCLICELPDPLPRIQEINPVGVDVGLKALIALSDGTIEENPYWLRCSLSRLRTVQRRASRRKKGSHRRMKAYKLLGKFYTKISNQRRDRFHKLSHFLVSRYCPIAIEDLRPKFIQSCKKLGLASQDSGMSAFRRLLEYKALAAGVQVIAVNPMFTSQRCSGCGELVEKDLHVRIHDCPFCRLVLDRDVNAARNILKIALENTDSPKT